MKRTITLAAAAMLASCVQYNVDKGDGTTRARLGQSVALADFEVTPLEVIEDSRCPADSQCAQAGQLRLRTRLDFDSRIVTRELTLGEAQTVGAGVLKLVEAKPKAEHGREIYPEDYRFGFTFAPDTVE